MDGVVKQEIFEPVVLTAPPRREPGPSSSNPVPVIDLSSSDSDSGDDEEEQQEGSMGKARGLDGDYEEGGPLKRRRKSEDGAGTALPLGFLDPLPPEEPPLTLREPISVDQTPVPVTQSCKQFWKAGDYEGEMIAESTTFTVGMDHLRVHPKFLHSNATSHKWALGAFAELLDNALDEVCHGATFVNIDMLTNKKDGTKMLLVEDNGGGMDPDKMRQCMSLGYSVKSKIANTIGQYGNGFKTSTMRLGADVIVFSRCHGNGGKSPTQSIGMLSYTFLRNTGKEDIVVPMLDYEKRGQTWNRMMRSSSVDWDKNLETIMQWSPYSSEKDLLQQFSSVSDQGTRIVIYNLWEDDQGELELDFGVDKHDIQVRGVNRDERKIEMAKQFPNSRHFLTYRHSLRSYASIIYLRLPRNFRMILRGKEIEHHNIVNDMMLKQEVTYRPQPGADGVPKDPNMVAVVTIGFVKDAKDHIDVQGFNVYHKNRLIKPFWRVWNAAGSDGRGVIGVLEANFVEPAHDKQGFERTTVLARLEQRLIQMQKQYWTTNCHRIGYAPRRNKKIINASEDKESSPEELPQPSFRHSRKDTSPSSTPPLLRKAQDSIKLRNDKSHSDSNPKLAGKGDMSSIGSLKVGNAKDVDRNLSSTGENRMRGSENNAKKRSTPQSRSHEQLHAGNESDSDVASEEHVNRSDASRPPPTQNYQKESSHSALSSSIYSANNGTEKHHSFNGRIDRIATRSHLKEAEIASNGNKHNLEDSDAVTVKQLQDENRSLKDRIKEMDTMLQELKNERDRSRSLTEKLEAAEKKLEEANKEQEALIDIFSEERTRRDKEEENLRKKLKESSVTIQDLLERLSSKNQNSS